MTEQGYSSEEQNRENSAEAVLGNYERIELQGEDLDEYNELRLPHDHPHVLAKAMLSQLERLPMMEMDSDQELFSGHRVALSA